VQNFSNQNQYRIRIKMSTIIIQHLIKSTKSERDTTLTIQGNYFLNHIVLLLILFSLFFFLLLFYFKRWDQWVPNDEATKEEIAENKRLLEEQKNKEFESQNPEFCSQFLSDAEKRQQIIAKKQESADISRLKGNRYFKARNFERALELYMEALKESPYDAKTLLNVAQVCIFIPVFDFADPLSADCQLGSY